MDDGLDYEVHTKIRFWLDFTGDGEFNSLLLPDVQQSFVSHVKELYEQDAVLGSYISSDLHFHFDGRWVDLEYTFSCHDENEAEAESFSEYSVRQIQEGLEKFGCKLTRVTCSAEEADMTWYEQLEDAIFGTREASMQIEKERVENFVRGYVRDTGTQLVKKLQPCPTLACIAGNIPPEKDICWNITEECYRVRSKEIKLCLHGLIEHGASLAAQGSKNQLHDLRDFVCALAAYWPENPETDDPWETEKAYGSLFDDTINRVRASRDAPELSKEQKENILIGLENYIIDLASQFSEIGQEALEGGLGVCESVASGLQQTWAAMEQTQNHEPMECQPEQGGMTMQ